VGGMAGLPKKVSWFIELVRDSSSDDLPRQKKIKKKKPSRREKPGPDAHIATPRPN